MRYVIISNLEKLFLLKITLVVKLDLYIFIIITNSPTYTVVNLNSEYSYLLMLSGLNIYAPEVGGVGLSVLFCIFLDL